MLQFPNMGSLFDSQTYEEGFSDPSISQEMEGGYEITRPAHTRAPTGEFTFSYPMLSDVNKETLKSFWADTKGRSEIFTWTNPADEVERYVRFAEAPRYKQVGAGATRLWSVSLKLKEV